MIRNLLINIGVPFNLNMLHKIAGVNPLIINYHMVSDKYLPYIGNLYKYRNVDLFNEEIKFLANRYRPLGLEELLYCLKTDTKIPENAFLITFDDGFREIYDNAASILIENKVPATFFLTNQFIDNKIWGHDNIKSLIIEKLRNEPKLVSKLSSHFQQITQLDVIISHLLKLPYKSRERLNIIAALLEMDLKQLLLSQQPYLTTKQVIHLINSGFTIGSHSLDHANFRELSLEEQKLQIKRSVEDIQNKFGLNYSVFAFPYTDLDIGSELFLEISEWIDATFGTQGHFQDEMKNHFQRINLEKFPQTTSKLLKYYYLHSIGHKIIGKGIIRHT